MVTATKTAKGNGRGTLAKQKRNGSRNFPRGNHNSRLSRIIAVGGSAGGIQSLSTILRTLPPDLASALLVVIHMWEGGSHLDQVLQRSTGLKVLSPQRAEPIAPGIVYLPSPNRHLMVRHGCIASVMGPRESRHRPSVNKLFRSAARVYRGSVIGVVLSGALDDGSAGALAIKARGGTIIVEDPSSAQMPDMPRNVLKQVGADYCLPADQIADLLVSLVSKTKRSLILNGAKPDCEAAAEPLFQELEPPGLACPDCDGVLMQIGKGRNSQFRCHVGHTFSLKSLTEGQADALERALWVALRRLNEQRFIQNRLSEAQADPRLKHRHEEHAVSVENDINLLHQILSRL